MAPARAAGRPTQGTHRSGFPLAARNPMSELLFCWARDDRRGRELVTRCHNICSVRACGEACTAFPATGSEESDCGWARSTRTTSNGHLLIHGSARSMNRPRLITEWSPNHSFRQWVAGSQEAENASTGHKSRAYAHQRCVTRPALRRFACLHVPVQRQVIKRSPAGNERGLSYRCDEWAQVQRRYPDVSAPRHRATANALEAAVGPSLGGARAQHARGGTRPLPAPPEGVCGSEPTAGGRGLQWPRGMIPVCVLPPRG